MRHIKHKDRALLYNGMSLSTVPRKVSVHLTRINKRLEKKKHGN